MNCDACPSNSMLTNVSVTVCLIVKPGVLQGVRIPQGIDPKEYDQVYRLILDTQVGNVTHIEVN